MVHQDGGKGSLILDRLFKGVGRLRIASGQPNDRTGRARHKLMDKMLTDLYLSGNHDYLRRLKRREISPLQLWDAYKSHRLVDLPAADVLPVLVESFKQWMESAPTGKHNRAGRKQALAVLQQIAPSATVGDLYDVLMKYQALCMKQETPSAFNHNKTHFQKFAAMTLGKEHPLYTKMLRIERLKVVRKRKAGLPLSEAVKVWAFLEEEERPDIRHAFRELCITGMRPREYLSGNWSVLVDRIEVRGTKTEGSDRIIPLVETITGSTVNLSTLRYYLNKYPGGKLEPYTARRTFAHFMEEAGIPRTRRRMYLGHSGKDISDLYERSQVTAYLAEDATALRKFLGIGGLKLEKQA